MPIPNELAPKEPVARIVCFDDVELEQFCKLKLHIVLN